MDQMQAYVKILTAPSAIRRAVWSLIMMAFLYAIIALQHGFHPIQVVAN